MTVKEQINPYWKARPVYSLLELAYLAAGENPKTYAEFREKPNQIIVSFISQVLDYFSKIPEYEPLKAKILLSSNKLDQERIICEFQIPMQVANILMTELKVLPISVKPHDMALKESVTEETPSLTQTEALKPWLVHDPKDPDPEQPWYTPARYFARQLVIKDSTLLAKRDVLAQKVALSLNNAGIKNSRKGKFSQNGTILKAWVNVNLG